MSIRSETAGQTNLVEVVLVMQAKKIAVFQIGFVTNTTFVFWVNKAEEVEGFLEGRGRDEKKNCLNNSFIYCLLYSVIIEFTWFGKNKKRGFIFKSA